MVIVDGSSPTSLDSGSQEGVSSHRGSAGVEGEGLSYRWRSLDDISPRLVQARQTCSRRSRRVEKLRNGITSERLKLIA